LPALLAQLVLLDRKATQAVSVLKVSKAPLVTPDLLAQLDLLAQQDRAPMRLPSLAGLSAMRLHGCCHLPARLERLAPLARKAQRLQLSSLARQRLTLALILAATRRQFL
jgi:hypothetical protein